MKDLKLAADPALLAAFPSLRVGGFIVEHLNVAAENLADLSGLWAEAEEALEYLAKSPQNLLEDPRIDGWRRAISACGLKPKTFKSSPEQLVRRILKGERIDTPLPVVNAYCAVSSRYLAPLGGYDVAQLPSAEVEVRYASPRTDSFTPLAGSASAMPIMPDVAVYATGNTVLCYAFNHRDARQTALRRDTSRGVFFSEAINEAQTESATDALERLRSILEDHGAQTGPIGYASKETPVIQISA